MTLKQIFFFFAHFPFPIVGCGCYERVLNSIEDVPTARLCNKEIVLFPTAIYFRKVLLASLVGLLCNIKLPCCMSATSVDWLGNLYMEMFEILVMKVKSANNSSLAAWVTSLRFTDIKGTKTVLSLSPLTHLPLEMCNVHVVLFWESQHMDFSVSAN